MPSATPADLPELPAEIRTCERVLNVDAVLESEKTVGEGRVLRIWASDRRVAVDCRSKLLAVVSYYDDVRTRFLEIDRK